MIQIFVEGKNDENFINSYIKYIVSYDTYKIVPVNGYTNIEKVVSLFKENTENKGINLVIFDSDYKRNGGGIETRKKYIQNVLKDNSISAEIFLLPNNKDEGNLETLLENIINQDHKCVLECFESYEKCLRGFKDDNDNPIYITPNTKAKIYAYIESMKKTNPDKSRFSKDKDFLFDNSYYWNLDSKYLEPLKEFLLENLDIPKD